LSKDIKADSNTTDARTGAGYVSSDENAAESNNNRSNLVTGPSSSSKSNASRRWLADINLVGVAVIWGVNMPIMKFGLGEMDKYLFNALRLTLSAAVLGLLFLWHRGAILDRSSGADSIKRQLAIIVVFGFLTGFSYQVLFLLGIAQTSAGNTAVIMSAIPVWIAGLAFLLLGERLSIVGWVGLSVAICGTLVVMLCKGQGTSGESSIVGNLLVLGAAFSWAVGSVISRPMMKNISPLSLAFVSLATMVPLHYVVAWNSLGEIPVVLSNPLLVAVLCFSGVFSTGLAYAMWNYGVKQIGAANAAGFQNLVPLVALLSSWVLIGEVPYQWQLVGGALIIAGLIVMRRAQPKSKK